MRDRMSVIFWHPVTTASRAPRFLTTWPRNDGLWGREWVVGLNIKREMVLSPNDEEVANSSKKQTQLKTRRHKPYPVSDQNGRNWYPNSNQNGWKKTFWRGTYLYSLYKGLPPGWKTRCRLWVSLLTQARLMIVLFEDVCIYFVFSLKLSAKLLFCYLVYFNKHKL